MFNEPLKALEKSRDSNVNALQSPEEREEEQKS